MSRGVRVVLGLVLVVLGAAILASMVRPELAKLVPLFGMAAVSVMILASRLRPKGDGKRPDAADITGAIGEALTRLGPLQIQSWLVALVIFACIFVYELLKR